MAILTVQARDLRKVFTEDRVTALDGVSLDIARGESVAITGPSGCGKSTLLSLLGALDQPTSGHILYDGQALPSRGSLAAFRARTVGFVFQFHHLIPTMTLVENVEAPLVAISVPRKERRARAMQLLTAMGVADRARSLPSRISGGQRQRVAVARALVNRPKVILADEPTGNLDSANSSAVMDLLLEHVRSLDTTLLIATHDQEIAARADRILHLEDGRLVG